MKETPQEKDDAATSENPPLCGFIASQSCPEADSGLNTSRPALRISHRSISFAALYLIWAITSRSPPGPSTGSISQSPTCMSWSLDQTLALGLLCDTPNPGVEHGNACDSLLPPAKLYPP